MTAPQRPSSATPTLTVHDLVVTRGTKPILRGVNLDIRVGEVCGVMGVSGAGKTTVLRCIAALQSFNAGAITVDGVQVKAGPILPESQLKELRRRIGVVFQSNALFEHLSVLDNVTLAPVHALGWTRQRANETAHKLLDSLGVDARAAAFPRELSGGEAQRVAIARALAPDPLMLLMDEPTSALDPARRAALGELVRSLAEGGRGLLIVTHDLDFAQDWCDRVIVLADGAVVEDGPARQILEHPTHAATRALLSQTG